MPFASIARYRQPVGYLMWPVKLTGVRPESVARTLKLLHAERLDWVGIGRGTGGDHERAKFQHLR